MSEPKRIQRKRTKGWRLPPDAVIVTRPTKWGNPFHIGGKLGDVPWKVVRVAGLTDQPVDTIISRGMASRLYRVWLREKLEDDPFFLNPLMGRDLACWCSSTEPCHADILLEFANKES